MPSNLQCALALACLAAAGAVLADVPPPMDEAAYKAAVQAVDTRHDADRKLCKRAKGNAADVCRAEADGRAEVARAKLDAEYEPSPDTRQAAKNAAAEADYRVARAKCKALEGKAEDRCMDQAKATREAAIRLAKVEKVRETGGPFASGAQQRKGGRS